MNVAIVGDVHGHHHRMVQQLQRWERKQRRAIDLVLQVGDFEPHRDEDDLRSMSAPSKYKALGDFPDFYQGRATIPWPLHFIGGNHEPHLWLEQSPEGAELLPGLHYLGRSGYRRLPQGLGLMGISGIFEEQSFTDPRPPIEQLDHTSNKAFISINEDDIERALDVDERVDILLLHDWPEGIGDGRISRRHPHLNPYSRLVIEQHRPRHVFCGHMHRRYQQVLRWEDQSTTTVICLAHILQGAESFIVLDEIMPR